MALSRSWLQRWLVVSVLGIAALSMLAPAGLAHPGGTASDGCHYCRTNCDSWGEAWNERHCHGGTSSGSTSGGSSGSTTPPPPPADTDPPARPDVDDTTVDGSTVTVDVSAEDNSTVRIAVAGTTVATARATGDVQAVTFTLADGTHRLEVTARDAAGNVSPTAVATVVVDGTAPAPADLEVASVAEASSPWTVVRVSGEPGAAWELVAAGLDGQSGTLPAGGDTDVELLAPNGTHQPAVVLTDAAGNVSEEATIALEVSIAAPDVPELEATSAPGAGAATVAVSGPPAGTATVEVRDADGVRVADEDVDLDDDGRGEATFDLDDGTYELVSSASDFQGQGSAGSRLDLRVDTVGPEIDLEVDEELLGQGRIAWSVLTEAGAVVRVAMDDLDAEDLFDADGNVRTGAVETDRSGDFELEVVATDAFGNETVRTVQLAVSQPTEPVAVAVGLAMLAGLAYAGYRGVRWAVGKVRTARTGR